MDPSAIKAPLAQSARLPSPMAVRTTTGNSSPSLLSSMPSTVHATAQKRQRTRSEPSGARKRSRLHHARGVSKDIIDLTEDGIIDLTEDGIIDLTENDLTVTLPTGGARAVIDLTMYE